MWEISRKFQEISYEQRVGVLRSRAVVYLEVLCRLMISVN